MKTTALLIDDDPVFLQTAARFLKEEGSVHVVGTAETAEAGVESARTLQPDIVLLDLSLPEASGLSVLPALRQAVPSASIIVVTMLEGEGYRTRAHELGAVGFIPKRRLVDDLVPEIRRLRPGSEGPPRPALESQFPPRAEIGIPGLDFILRGGVPEDEAYLVQGGPGTGKTTLGLHFLRAGAAEGETTLYLTLSQTERSLERIAASHGWTLDGVVVHEVGLEEETSQSVFHPSEVQLGETLAQVREAVEEVGPTRLVVDTVADLRVLSSDVTQYRRELRRLRRFLTDRGCTALFLDDSPERGGDRELQNQANGVLALRQEAPDYGEVGRWLQVVKMRSTPFLSGSHSFRIRTGGLEVYPRVQASGVNGYVTWEPRSSGVPELDEMLGGGLREGTTCVVAGPTGSGKSAVAFQHAYAAAERGETAAVFLFNERLETFYMRARGLGMAMESHVEAGRLLVEQVNTGVVAPSEFAQRVRRAVERGGASVVVVDSLSGYINAMLRRNLLVSQLHELVTYLSQQGVLTLLVADRSGEIAGGDHAKPSHVSYLADSVILLGYHEEGGLRRRTISVLKQRHGAHANDARELHLDGEGLSIGERTMGAGLTLDPHLFATLFPGSTDGQALASPEAQA